MLATFLVGSTTTILCDVTNIAGGGRIGFNWEEWGVSASVTTTPLFDAVVPSKRAFGNLDRKVGFRGPRSFLAAGGDYAAALAALDDWLKQLDALCGQTGTLILQRDSRYATTLQYDSCILRSVTLLTSAEETTGVRVAVSYKFEPTTLT
jgi:hypothetical protein